MSKRIVKCPSCEQRIRVSVSEAPGFWSRVEPEYVFYAAIMIAMWAALAFGGAMK